MRKFLLFGVHISLLFICSCAGQETTHGQIPENKELESMVDSSDMQQAKAIKEIPLREVMGQFEPSNLPNFVMIDEIYADQAGRWLQKEAYEAFIQMHAAAKKDGIDLIIKSSTRNFDDQKSIWERKWNGQTTLTNGVNLGQSRMSDEAKAKMILLYSSMPGTSRHHWGTDIDLNDFENEYFETAQGKKEYEWLVLHAEQYGYCQVYTPKGVDRPNGYEEEKWHWSYMPLAKAYQKRAQAELTNEMITGFDGSSTAVNIGIVENYILGINKKCIQWQ